MTTTAFVRARVDGEIQERAAAVLADIGLTVSDAIRMLLTRIAKDGTLPIELAIPNPETRAAMLRAREITVGKFASFEELVTNLEKTGD